MFEYKIINEIILFILLVGVNIYGDVKLILERDNIWFCCVIYNGNRILVY